MPEMQNEEGVNCARERDLLHGISKAARKIMLHDSGPDVILTILPALEAIWRWEREQKEQVGD